MVVEWKIILLMASFTLLREGVLPSCKEGLAGDGGNAGVVLTLPWLWCVSDVRVPRTANTQFVRL